MLHFLELKYVVLPSYLFIEVKIDVKKIVCNAASVIGISYFQLVLLPISCIEAGKCLSSNACSR
jgi:hypothetical protein